MVDAKQRRQMVGRVVGDDMQKTVVVAVTRKYRHKLYKRVVQRTKKYLAHVETVAKLGDIVRIEECRPMSKRKRWRVREVIEVAK